MKTVVGPRRAVAWRRMVSSSAAKRAARASAAARSLASSDSSSRIRVLGSLLRTAGPLLRHIYDMETFHVVQVGSPVVRNLPKFLRYFKYVHLTPPGIDLASHASR